MIVLESVLVSRGRYFLKQKYLNNRLQRRYLVYVTHVSCDLVKIQSVYFHLSSRFFTFTYFPIPGVSPEASDRTALAPEHVQTHVLLQLTPARPGALMGTPDDVRSENIVSTFLLSER